MSGRKGKSGNMPADEAERMREVTKLIMAGRWDAPNGGDEPPHGRPGRPEHPFGQVKARPRWTSRVRIDP